MRRAHPPFQSLLLLLALLMAPSPGYAQLQVGALIDTEIKKGGSDSSHLLNQTPTDEWTLYTPNIRLFFSGSVGTQWEFFGSLQADHYFGVELSDPFVSILNIRWKPDSRGRFEVVAGRFVTPFGRYQDRLLSLDNWFVHLPLTHARLLPVSKVSGIYPFNRQGALRYDGLDPQAILYQRFYSQGLMLTGKLANETFSYYLAATTAPASTKFDVIKNNRPSFIGRIEVQPFIWAKLGISANNGPYLKPAPENDFLSDAERSRYTQTSFNTDLTLSYAYYQLAVDWTWNRWLSPNLNFLDLVNPPPLEELEAIVNVVGFEGRMDFPFLVGSYAAVRYEFTRSNTIQSQVNYYGITATANINWMRDTDRAEFVLGYKVRRGIILKASYLYSTNAGVDLDDDVVAVQLSFAI